MPPATTKRPANATSPQGFVFRAPVPARPVSATFTPAAERGELRPVFPEYASGWADPYHWTPRAGQVPIGSTRSTVNTPGHGRNRTGVGGVVGVGASGLGATGTEIANTATATAATIAGSNTAAIAGTLGVAVPVVGVIIAGAVLAVTTWLNRMGPKQKRWTTQIADEATAQLQAVKQAYFATPYNPANQAAALGAVDQLLQAIQDGCGQTQMGEPGRRCIAERLVRGGSAPWCPTGAGCDYFTEYRDPIAQDARAAQWGNAIANPQTPADFGQFGAGVTAAAQGAVGAVSMLNSAFVPVALGLVALVFVFRGVKG
jgi:hypothetical protein